MAEALLKEAHTEEEMQAVVWYEYITAFKDGEDRFNINADLLWIWRQFGETYTIRRQVNEIPPP